MIVHVVRPVYSSLIGVFLFDLTDLIFIFPFSLFSH